MNSHSKLLFFILCTIFILLRISIAQQQPDFLYYKCVENGNFTKNSNYQINLETLLSAIPSNIQDYGFYNSSSVDLNSDRVNAIALCRGDVSIDTCRSCIGDSIQKLTLSCPYNKEAIGWYDQCMLRYTNRSNIFGTREDSPAYIKWNLNNVSKADPFNEALNNLMYDLKKKAASGDFCLKFATGKLHSIYGLVQCTPDLSEPDCDNCLGNAISQIPSYLNKSQGGRYSTPSCNIRYETRQFYGFNVTANSPSPPPQPLSTNTTTTTKGKNSMPPQPLSTNTPTTTKDSTAMIVGITVSSIVVVAAVLGSCSYHYCKKWRLEDYETSQEILNGDSEDQDHTGEMQYFRLTTIKAATNNFSDFNKLGEGGFGPVYKGKLVDGKDIAVKRLLLKSGQGLKEFKNEVMFIVKLQLNNLVRLLGCCVERNEKLLVYEYLANTSLDVFLFDQEKCKQLDWDLRANIVSGIAKGIQYLHEDSRLKIIHRDLKASNILLDDEMNPKISDFGTARMFAPKQKEDSTNRPIGTYGYMAPEYAMEGLFSMKSDVYSFRILLLEIVSGKKNSGFYQTDHTHSQSLLSYVWQLWNEGKRQEFIDQNIIDTCSTTEALRWIHIALLCVQEDPNDRPSISSVILMLCSKISDLPRPSAPPFSVSRFLLSDQSSTMTGGTGNGFLASDQSSTSASLCR